MAQEFGRILIVFGAIIMIVGTALYFGGQIGLGRLPGDILYKNESFTFYFPLTTGILISIVLTLLWNLFRR